ncbi:UDP-N-acetylglucosamine--undecaprenyl-phosphate N-acetylglucosaminephosphotransferase [Psychromonas hadalis]|uniref:UDP-N-acetylglucosamine--undecaprenyl-phosphate N-acetylglucosaminephosphotransferase n=1 Tax=Psychromonas hadalis TaxID=211669 RepID=UPI0003B2FB22|nr:UDP-N-acetylglucosamine--undecaprenyl-phosphate N-acetylglucosaminephosphotransferase [Psychromonas hadalis]
MLAIIVDLTFIFLFALAMLFSLRKVARHPAIGLVDKPNECKHHQGAVPLVGGISICLSVLYFLYNNQYFFPHSDLYSISIVILVGMGVLDDKFDISVKLRMSVQAGLAVVMINLANIQLIELGDMFGFGYIVLPNIAGKIITVFAVIGAINAFNMVDGIDGLLGGLASVTFAALGFLFMQHSLSNYAYLCTVFIVVILPYILFNLGFFGRTRKVFMGDAGSMLIGFTVIWLLISGSQSNIQENILRPVTALWLIALPLMDMASIMFRRVRRGDSPFKPDREHLHHICQRLGLNSTQTLLAICSVSLLCASIGVLGEVFNVPEAIMFYLFITFFIIYSILLSNIWKVVKRVRGMKRLSRMKRLHH